VAALLPGFLSRWLSGLLGGVLADLAVRRLPCLLSVRRLAGLLSVRRLARLLSVRRLAGLLSVRGLV
jgi:hypothetical protein